MQDSEEIEQALESSREEEGARYLLIMTETAKNNPGYRIGLVPGEPDFPRELTHENWAKVRDAVLKKFPSLANIDVTEYGDG